MRFTHFSDCHIGGWRDEKMSELGLRAFKTAIEQSIEKQADFVLIAGDLFNSALPPLDKLKGVIISLVKLKNNNIPCYVIPGSHDFSPSGKTMLDILEHTGLLTDVCKGSVENDVLNLRFTIDKKTGTKITGMIGKKGMLDRKYYEQLNRIPLEKEEGFKIFMFHTALSELKPRELEKMESSPLSLLPKGFDYYAGGHVHIVDNKTLDNYKNVSYPGALFPNSFSEIEKFKHGGYYLYDNGNVTWNPIVVKDVVCLHFDCNSRTPSEIEMEILHKIKELDVKDKIVTVRLQGTLHTGKPSDIKMNEIIGILYHKGAYFVMRSTSLLNTKESEIMQVHATTVEEAEDKIIKENIDNTIPNEEQLIRDLMKIFSIEKHEGETKYNFEKRLLEEAKKITDL